MVNGRRRTVLRVVTIVAALGSPVLALQAVGWGHGREEPLAVTRLILVDRREVEHGLVEETYRGELTHTAAPGSPDRARVTAHLAHQRACPQGIKKIVDGDLFFGSARAGQTVESEDTITVRRHRHPRLEPSHLRWAISSRPDLLLPDTWAGRWQLTVTSRDAATGQVVAIDEITDVLGADEPLGLSALPRFVRCTSSGSDVVLESHCGLHARIADCLLEGSADFTVQREGDALTGAGTWHSTAEGECPGLGAGGQEIEITGVRMAEHADTGRFSPGAIAKFALSPALVLLREDGGPAPRTAHATEGEAMTR